MSLSSTASSPILLLLLLAATVSAAATTSIRRPVEEHAGDVNTTTTVASNSSATTTTTDKDNFEMYFCFLCSGRDPLLIHHCPIYWDECHLICDYPPMVAATPPAPPAAPALPSSSSVQGDADCYVMKLYMSGRYVIVQRMPCKYIAWCFLTCGGGELADDRNVITGRGSTRTTTTMPVTIQGSFLPAVELCGTQANALRVPLPPSAGGGGGGVPLPAGGAHRRR